LPIIVFAGDDVGDNDVEGIKGRGHEEYQGVIKDTV